MTAGFRGPDGCAGMTTTKGGPVLKRSGMRRGGWGFVLVLAATLGWGLGSVSPAAAETLYQGLKKPLAWWETALRGGDGSFHTATVWFELRPVGQVG